VSLYHPHACRWCSSAVCTLLPMPDPSILTIGNFDGVHAGHASLIARARHLAANRHPGARVVALAFDPSPVTILNPQRVPARLSTFAQRYRWLTALGASDVVQLIPTPDLLSLTADEFVARARDRFNAVGWVAGPDFRFGKGRGGTMDTIRAALGQPASVEQAPAVDRALSDHTVVRASSTVIRTLVAAGRVHDAWSLLGRPYQIEGVVVRGDRRGRSIGFPTANIETTQLLPAHGVYSAIAEVVPITSQPADSIARLGLVDAATLRVPAAVNVGARPTFPNAPPTLEAHLILPDPPASIDRDGTIPAWSPIPALRGIEYGWGIRLSFIAHLRDQVRFPALSALVEQLRRDVDRARDSVAMATNGDANMLARGWNLPTLDPVVPR
jgi:riboflavin kinase/FMN adenylyltransferase